MAVFAVLIAAIVWLGLYPQPLLKTAKPALEALLGPAVAQQARAQK
jgi:NADH:ubiquinone oxidoreductase subunit 4 (subunit M)